jgi:transcriptional regulator with XRE-family HTH domain
MNTLKFYREKTGLSQNQVAEKLNVCQQAVAKWEIGTAYPSTAKLPEMAKIYGLTEGEVINAITAAKNTQSETERR